MQDCTDQYLQALKGTVTPVVTADVYYAGEQTYQGLPISTGSVIDDTTQAVTRQLSLTVADPDGSLVPRTPTDILAPFGTEINIRAGLNINGQAETFSMGWFRLVTGQPSESWRWLKRSTETDLDAVVVPSAASIPLTGYGRLWILDDDTFLSVDAPQSQDAIAEIVRLVGDSIPIDIPASITGNIPATSSITYSGSRLDAVTQVAAAIGMAVWETRDGALSLRAQDFVGDDWNVAVDAGFDGAGTMGKVDRTMSATATKNGIKVVGRDSSNNPITKFYTQTSGPFAWDGPYGHHPATTDVEDALLDTEAKVDARGALELQKLLTTGTQSLDVPTVPNAALDTRDRLVMTVPTWGTVQAPITRIEYQLRGAQTTTVTLTGTGDSDA